MVHIIYTAIAQLPLFPPKPEINISTVKIKQNMSQHTILSFIHSMQTAMVKINEYKNGIYEGAFRKK